MSSSSHRRGPLTGLAAAVLFGASTPFAKLLVPGAGPLILAGLLYVGAALGLSAAARLRRSGAEAPIRRADLPALAVATAAGGVLGPILLVMGLARLSGASAALLLNLEAPFTIALAVVMLGEHLSPRELLGAGIVIVGAGALTWAPGALEASPVGGACIAGACAAWALDNNVSQRLSMLDPVAVARAKTLGAGAFNLTLGLAVGERLPSHGHVAGALLTGAIGYGLSIVLHLLAVRAVGAARQAAYFATAPFIGAVLAVPVLHDRVSPLQLAAGVLMAFGVGLIVRTRHAHVHAHAAQEHEHAHVHDEHHAHVHVGPVIEPHSHVHQHEQIVHDHPHAPDLHHRHGH